MKLIFSRSIFVPLSTIWGLPWGMGKLMGSATRAWRMGRGPGAMVYCTCFVHRDNPWKPAFVIRTVPCNATYLPTHTHMAVGKPADGAGDAGGALGQRSGLAQPGRGNLGQPRPTSTDLGQLPLDQPGRAPSANLGQPQPTSIKVGRGAIKM